MNGNRIYDIFSIFLLLLPYLNGLIPGENFPEDADVSLFAWALKQKPSIKILNVFRIFSHPIINQLVLLKTNTKK